MEGRRVADLLAAAFAEDPLMDWLLPGRRNSSSARRRLFAQAVRIFSRDGLIEMSDDRRSAAIWASPHRAQQGRLVRPLDQLRGAFATLLAAGSAANRSIRLYEVMRTHRPSRPHWYLSAIGTDPSARRRGAASALLASRLAECDAEGAEAYLESSNSRNLPLYERHGFEILRQITVDDSPPLWLMLRAPHRLRFD